MGCSLISLRGRVGTNRKQNVRRSHAISALIVLAVQGIPNRSGIEMCHLVVAY